jgi:membrane peptidoglycan carboxypeptidase
VGTSSRRSRSTQKSTKRRIVLPLLVIAGALAGLGAIGIASLVAATEVPDPNDVATSEATIVYYANGRSEVGRLGEATRRSVDLDEIPPIAREAVLAAEDRTFYAHGGISPIGIARAAWNNVTGGSTQGGSTITQQYAKNAYLTQDRSWNRKLKEALLAFKLETLISKDDILEDYLNTIYFGRGAYGIEAASIAYFGIPASELDASQAAVLAAVIKSPSGLSPENDPDGLRARWSYVLDSMVDEEWLTQKDRDRATFPDIVAARQGNRFGGQTGYLLNAVRDELIALGFDEQEIERGGLRIVSTFDRRAQRAAAAAVRKAGPDSGLKGLRIGLAAVRPGTGEIVAMYGGRDFIKNQINNATRPFAQAGSTFKPFTLAAAFEDEIGLNSVWNGDSPLTVQGYTLNNYGGNSYGPVTLLQATERSINTAYVEVESEVGVTKVADATLRAGIPPSTPGLNLESPDLTFVLGTASPSALSMANAYATFAARGTRADPVTVKQVFGPNGGLLYEHQPQPVNAFDSRVADAVSYALRKAVTDGTGRTAQALGRPAAGKTGTTDDNRSAWFAGYTPQLSAAVLFAKEDADGKPVSLSGTGGLSTVTGGSFPAAIWTAFMSAALAKEPVLDFPDPPKALTAALVCPTDGTLGPPGCPEPEIDVDAEFDPIPGEAEAPDDAPAPLPEDYDPATPSEPSDPARPQESFEPVPAPSANEFGPET